MCAHGRYSVRFKTMFPSVNELFSYKKSAVIGRALYRQPRQSIISYSVMYHDIIITHMHQFILYTL